MAKIEREVSYNHHKMLAYEKIILFNELSKKINECNSVGNTMKYFCGENCELCDVDNACKSQVNID